MGSIESQVNFDLGVLAIIHLRFDRRLPKEFHILFHLCTYIRLYVYELRVIKQKHEGWYWSICCEASEGDCGGEVGVLARIPDAEPECSTSNFCRASNLL